MQRIFTMTAGTILQIIRQWRQEAAERRDLAALLARRDGRLLKDAGLDRVKAERLLSSDWTYSPVLSPDSPPARRTSFRNSARYPNGSLPRAACARPRIEPNV